MPDPTDTPQQPGSEWLTIEIRSDGAFVFRDEHRRIRGEFRDAEMMAIHFAFALQRDDAARAFLAASGFKDFAEAGEAVRKMRNDEEPLFTPAGGDKEQG
jgi:hypothetical protein